ncbi:MAG: DegT/DnrJ/EryC1/StrS family aminotransferase [Deltaproteobacteria bacterium]|nr:DegT/DnrJ/EryC1/StrS family aminotransferase [Deltaproteobacteria bacterium]
MIPLTKPLLDNEDFQAVLAPLQSGWLVQGPRVAQFEESVLRLCSAGHAVATSSCTTALHLTLVAAGIGPGDTVLVPSFTYVATANAVEHAGGRPVFVDIDPETLNISIAHLDRVLAEGKAAGRPVPRALLPVHLFGLCADMPEILKVADRYSLTVIEDAACALGSSVQDQSAGTFGLAGCFSFHPRKLITTGEGGMVVTNDESMAHRLRILRDHGAQSSDHNRHLRGQGEMPDFEDVGYNYRMTDIQGALGCSQMGKLFHIIKERRRLAEAYAGLFANVPWLRLPAAPEGFQHTYQSFVCRVSIKGLSVPETGKMRNSLMRSLAEAGISSRPGTHAVHLLGYYRRRYGFHPEDFPEAWLAHHNTITLPLYPGMTEQEQDAVAAAVRGFIP